MPTTRWWPPSHAGSGPGSPCSPWIRTARRSSGGTSRPGAGRYVLRHARLLELDGTEEHEILAVADLPVALGGLAPYNVANALAAAGGARAMGASLAEVADGLRAFRPTAALSPGRLNLYRLGQQVVIVDFAHNEAGTEAILEVAAAIARGATIARGADVARGTAGEVAPVTAIIGTAGDRPDETFRGIGRIAAGLAQRVVIKETLSYLRGRDRAGLVDLLREGIREGGLDPAGVPVHETEAGALEAELAGGGSTAAGDGADGGGRQDAPRVVVLLCHEDREGVFALLERLGARQVEVSGGVVESAPRDAAYG